MFASKSLVRLILLFAFWTGHAFAGPQDLFFEGFELYKDGKSKEAAAKFEAGLKGEPGNAMALFYLGEIHRSLKDTAKARQYYQASLKADPNSEVAAEAKNQLAKMSGNVFAGQGKKSTPTAKGPSTRECEDAFDAAQSSRDMSGMEAALLCKAGALQREGKANESEEALKYLVAIFTQAFGPDDPRTVSARGRMGADLKAFDSGAVAQTNRGSAGTAARSEPAAGSVWTEPSSGMDFVWVPGGCFVMGSVGGEADELPAHQVCVKGFYLGKYEVTQAQYQRLTGTKPSYFDGANLPVEKVSWGEAKSFADEMAYRSGQRIRLPSEAEWEYACRAGQQTELCGQGSIENLAWYNGNSGAKTHPVGSKRPNAWGLHDMSGNVWEWVEDCYSGNYLGAPADGSAWVVGACSQRVVRGGSWNYKPADVRSADRVRVAPSGRDINLGFRVARTLP
jgi:formylglycine-generating enzyme required for sulfatase activity